MQSAITKDLSLQKDKNTRFVHIDELSHMIKKQGITDAPDISSQNLKIGTIKDY